MALRLGVDGIKVEIFPWCKPEDDYFSKSSGNETVPNAVCLASECQKWGLHLMVETIPFGWPKADKKTNEQIAAACRVASEAGADYVKSFYTGDKSSFKEVIDNCSVPVLILGGASEWKIFYKIGLPLSKGAIAVLSLLVFLASWNDILWPLIVLRTPEMMTVPIGLANLSNLYKIEYGMILAGATLISIPVIIIFIIGRKHILGNLTIGSIKG